MPDTAIKHRRRNPATKPRTKRQYTVGPRKTEAEMLEPENVIELAEPGTSGETLTQRRLREFRELQEEFFDLKDRYAAAYDRLRVAIAEGAGIVQGQYKVRSSMYLSRRPKYKQALIDAKGEQYQRSILERTAPHAHFRVVIE